jgi:hypothetical protein
MKNDFTRRFWTGMGIIIGSIVLTGGAFYYLTGAMEQQATDVLTAKTNTENDASAVANLASLESQAPTAGQYEALFQKLLSNQQGLITFSSWVDQIGSKYGVAATVSFVGSSTPASAGAPGFVPFTMSAQGPEGSLPPFLDYLASKAPGFIVSFSSFDFTDDRSQQTLNAVGSVYFR